jgi:hypothetical protein
MPELRIYMHTSGDCVLHRSGFSWLAAFALPLWALSKRLYRTALVAFVVVLVVTQLVPRLLAEIQSETVRDSVAFVYGLLYWLVPGFAASRWHRRVLERNGYYVCASEEAPRGQASD